MSATVKTVSLTLERKFDLGSYNSLHTGIQAWFDVPEGEDWEALAREVHAGMAEYIKEVAQPILKAYGVKLPKRTTYQEQEQNDSIAEGK